MLQLYFEIEWEFWNTIGMVSSFLFVIFLLVFSEKFKFKKDSEHEIISLENLTIVMAIVLIPNLVGESLAAVATSILYPELFYQIFYRVVRYFLIWLSFVALVYLVIILSNRRKRKAGETQLDLS
jgi:lysylphosphatidylglycerol synthetase-like protein (DUF2156 family)